MKFWDREKEKEWLKRYLLSEPNAILFVYGPKSSGKTTLLMKVIEDLKGKIDPYYYDLRLVPISSYKDVLRIFFRERGWRERLVSAIPGIAKTFSRYFEVDAEVLKEIFDMKYNPFEVMENVLKGRRSRTGKVQVIVFDELQKLKDVYLNSPNNQRSLVKELFNFFVRLTKVLHLSHVIVMTSDTFFIEEVYTDSTLKNTSRFFLVDFFSDELAKEILEKEGMNEEDASYAADWIGGVPWMMEEVIEGGKGVVKELYESEKARFKEIFGKLYEEDPSLRDEAKKLLKKILTGEEVDLDGKDRKMIKKLVDMEALYYDPVKGVVKFQTKLDERAAKELLGAVG